LGEDTYRACGIPNTAISTPDFRPAYGATKIILGRAGIPEARMSDYHINRIASVLDQTFGSLVDMTDWSKRTAQESRSAFLSRALAALCIKAIAGTDDTTAAGTLVDGFDDGGIDALFFDQINDVFYFVQSKWSLDGHVPMNSNAGGRFADGVRDILARRIDRFNPKIKSKEAEILAALRAARPIKIMLVTVHTAEQEIGAHGRRKIDDLLAEINTPSLPDDASAIHLKQNDVYGLINCICYSTENRHACNSSKLGFHRKAFYVLLRPRKSHRSIELVAAT
jgi:hypothetical protein